MFIDQVCFQKKTENISQYLHAYVQINITNITLLQLHENRLDYPTLYQNSQICLSEFSGESSQNSRGGGLSICKKWTTCA